MIWALIFLAALTLGLTCYTDSKISEIQKDIEYIQANQINLIKRVNRLEDSITKLEAVVAETVDHVYGDEQRSSINTT